MRGNFSPESLDAFSRLAAEVTGTDFAEGETYDFARCVRPDGSAYGTRGKCKKGKESAKEAAAKGGKSGETRSERLKRVRGEVENAARGGAGSREEIDALKKKMAAGDKDAKLRLIAIHMQKRLDESDQKAG